MIEIGKKSRAAAWACALPFLIVVFLFEIMPLLAVTGNSLFQGGALSLGNYGEILGSRFYLNAFKASFAISLGDRRHRSDPRTCRSP